jgi:hypothetical protein
MSLFGGKKKKEAAKKKSARAFAADDPLLRAARECLQYEYKCPNGCRSMASNDANLSRACPECGKMMKRV